VGTEGGDLDGAGEVHLDPSAYGGDGELGGLLFVGGGV